MSELEVVIRRKLKHAKRRYDQVKHQNPETHNFHGGRTVGYYEGVVSTLENLLDELLDNA